MSNRKSKVAGAFNSLGAPTSPSARRKNADARSATRPTLTPKLRFPKFRDAPGWEDTILGNVLTEHGEKNNGSSEVHSVSVHKGVINQVEHLGRSFAAADRSNYNLAKPHDIIYTKSPTGDFPWGVVKQNRLPYNVIVSPLYGVFSPVNRHLGYILDAYFESPIRTTNYLAPITQKGAKNTIQISNATFLSKGLYLPSTEAEQQKIASCLSSLDDLIAAVRQKLDALKAHKKGLMQHLFPREGETRPRLRFSEFQNAPEWGESNIGDRCQSFSGGTPSTAQKEFYGGNIPFIRSAEIGKPVTELFLTELGLKNSAAKLVNKGDVLVALYGANSGDVALAMTDGAINQAILCLKPDADRAFLYHYLSLKKEWIVATYIQGGQGNLSGEIVKSIALCFPETNEQQRIATCLSTLDDLIAAQSDKIEALKTHKKGLMQQIFPSPKEEDA
jgi:type I restriction enzyme, S subunit